MERELINRLCRASREKTFEPDDDVAWKTPAPDRLVVPARTLSIAGLPEFAALDSIRRSELSRHEVASVFSVSIRFEDTLIRNLARYIQSADPLAVELPYFLHVIEEEARHNRMFIRLIEQLGVGGYGVSGLFGRMQQGIFALVRSSRCLFFLAVFAVEEITDRVFAEWLDGDELDPMVRDVCRIHRTEEARHRAFTRAMLRERYEAAGLAEKAIMVAAAPFVVSLIFDMLVPPSLYQRAAVTTNERASWRLWWRARASDIRMRLRERCAEAVLTTLKDLGALKAAVYPLWTAVGLPIGRA